MKALIIRPYNEIEVLNNLENDITTFQNLVDGYVEAIYQGDYIWLVNEEGKIRNLPKNILGLVGNVVIVRAGYEDFESLTDRDIEIIKQKLSEVK